jgi:hypothetical protein
MRNYAEIGVQVPDVLLPSAGIDPKQWAVIACDQFTSEPEYWDQVRSIVGNSPSTYHLILPEVYLGTPDEERRIQSTRQTMQQYLDQGVFDPFEGFIYVERTIGAKTRHGIMLALDLEQYDFTKGSQSLIRATEGTILDRLPPRIKIRKGAPLELPHILVLIDDPLNTVIAPITAAKSELKPLYDFELMLGSGHLTGYGINQPALETQIVQSIQKLASPQVFKSKYGVTDDRPPLLFAVGDGNHSLATAKSIWEQIKAEVGPDHPARYALIELENVHDSGLEFEPIHRLLFGLKQNILEQIKAALGDSLEIHPVADRVELIREVNRSVSSSHRIGYISSEGCSLMVLHHPKFTLPVASLGSFLDGFMSQGGAEKIDYVHGEDALFNLGSKPGNAAFYLPAMEKTDLFKTVVFDGALPRKTFSMGEAREKRFYFECRKIK